MEAISSELFNLINNGPGDMPEVENQIDQEEEESEEEEEYGEGEITDIGNDSESQEDDTQDTDDGNADDSEDEETYDEEEVEYLQSVFAEQQGFNSWDEMIQLVEQAKNGLQYETQIQEPDYDPEIIRLKELKEEGIDIFEASAIMQADYRDLSNPKDILLQHYILENPELTNEEAEELFEDEFSRMYDEDDNLSAIKLKKEAQKASRDLIQFQEYLKKPVTKIEDLRAAIKRVPVSRNQSQPELNISQEAVDNYTRDANDFLERKKVAFKFDDGLAFNYGFNKTELSDAFDRPSDFIQDKLQSYVKDLQSGKVDFEGLAKTFIMLKDPDRFAKSLIEHGKALGKESILKSMKNPSEQTSSSDSGYRTKKPVDDETAKILALLKKTR